MLLVITAPRRSGLSIASHASSSAGIPGTAHGRQGARSRRRKAGPHLNLAQSDSVVAVPLPQANGRGAQGVARSAFEVRGAQWDGTSRLRFDVADRPMTPLTASREAVYRLMYNCDIPL